MSRFFFRVEDVYFYLDSTSSMSTSYPARVSSSPMQDNTSQTDHYIVDQPICTINGVISDIKIGGAGSVSLPPQDQQKYKKTNEWIDDLLLKVRDAGVPVLLKNFLDKPETPNWFVTNFTPTQDATYGYGAKSGSGSHTKILSSYRVSIQLRQGLSAQGIKGVPLNDPAYADIIVSKGSKNSATQQFDTSNKKEKLTQETINKAIDDRLKAINDRDLLGLQNG